MPLNLPSIEARLKEKETRLRDQCGADPEHAELLAMLAIHQRLGELMMVLLRTR